MFPKIVVFTGIDGSGKTSHSGAIKEYLVGRGFLVNYVHQFAPSIRYIRKLKRTFTYLLGGVEANLIRPGTIEQDKYCHAMRRNRFLIKMAQNLIVIYSLAIGLARTWLKIMLSINRDVVIFDRYYIDEIIRLEWKFGINLYKLGWTCSLIPSPYCMFFLELSPEVAWGRKETGSLSKILFWEKNERYIKWIRRVGKTWKVLSICTDKESFHESQRRIRVMLSLENRAQDR
ncbi:MAG: hypothetical protein FJZ16_01905 [Candidatus Omnitrophica bacterium]|nr:hypothetical protein [Candidatus Omnitrophota bacterium]